MEVSKIIKILEREFGDNAKFIIPRQDQNIKNLLTDSRNYFSPEDSLFFAIKTEGGNDGHHYVKALYDKGVRNFIVQSIPEEFLEKEIAVKQRREISSTNTPVISSKYDDINFFILPDTIKALALIGSSHKVRAKEIVAITGSRGKTTLKEMIFQLMEPFKKISRSPRSFNSKIGVPLSLWQITPNSELALIEAGISRKGEMEPLVKTMEPDTVIFTNIGDAHNNGFISKEEKADEKIRLAQGPNIKTIIYSADDVLLESRIPNAAIGKNVIRWSTKNKGADLYIQPRLDGFSYTWQGSTHNVKTKIIKDYDLENMANALAFMLKEGIPAEKIVKQFASLKRISTRLNVSEGINGCSVILDSYTSDLSSLFPAIDFMSRRKMPFQTKTLVISDLHHEGGEDKEIYGEIAKIIKHTGITRFIGIGKVIGKYSNLFPENSNFFEDTTTFLNKFSAADFNDEIILLKGGPEYDFKKIYEQLEAKKHETVLEVNLDSILKNYNYFRSKLPSSTGVVAMVKASGYGAGSYEIAKTLQDAGAAYLAVAALDEGLELRKNGIVMPVMVMNPKAANYRALFKNRLEPVIYSMSMLSTLIEEAKYYDVGEYPVHIKLDTGMHRMGFEPGEIPMLKYLLQQSDNIKVSTIFSHLATADCLDMDNYTLRQIERFEAMSKDIMESLDYKVKRHILNSAGILRFPQYHYDLVRLGIGLYGANTLPAEIESPLAVVSTLRSVIICIREIEGDEAVGYSRKGKINGRKKIATIPIGYADGMNRKFGNGAVRVLVNGHQVPTIGNIFMDATMIDVTGIDCKEGDPVEIFGENISVQVLADTLDTIPYEILTSVSPRVKRVYYRE